MTEFQIIVGLIICISMVIKPFLYKPIALRYPAELSSVFSSVWILIAVIICFPFLGQGTFDRLFEKSLLIYWGISILKGIGLWGFTKLQQIVNKNSTSSSVFFGFISLALMSLTINLFFKEGLQLFQLLCISGFGVLGAVFMSFGDAKRLSAKGKLYFISLIVLGAFFGVSDHLSIPKLGWYEHLFASYLAMFACCLLAGISKEDWKNVFQNKQIVAAGLFNCYGEFLVIYASINILPVSFVSLFTRLAAPVVMIISAYRYKEQTIKNQLLFGVLAILLAVPLLMLK